MPTSSRVNSPGAAAVGSVRLLGRGLVLVGFAVLGVLIQSHRLWGPVAIALTLAGLLLSLGSLLRLCVRRVGERNRLHGYSLTELDQMSGEAFEDWVARSLSRSGFRCENLPRSHDYGIDLIATRAGCRIGVQAKRYEGPVGNGAVQQAIAGAGHHACEVAAVVTQSRFTAAARAQAGSASLPVLLIDRATLTDLGRRLRRARA